MKNKYKGDGLLSFWAAQIRKHGPRHYMSNKRRRRGTPAQITQRIENQGDKCFEALAVTFPDPSGIGNVLEFGCAWGRILTRVQPLYPNAQFTGVDLMPQAIEEAEALLPDMTFFVGDCIPPEAPRSDLIYTCACLQHITDQEMWERAVASITENANPGCHLVLLESAVPSNNVRHMSDRRGKDYREAFKAFEFTEMLRVSDGRNLPAHRMTAVKI